MLNWQLSRFEELTLRELYDILRLRAEVFVVEQNCPYVDEDGKDIPSHHLCGRLGSELAAYARIVPAGVSYEEVSVGRIITSGKYRGQGYGRLLMQKLIAETERLYGHVPIRIGAQYYLKAFYESFGFEDVHQPYHEDGIAHLIMLRKAS